MTIHIAIADNNSHARQHLENLLGQFSDIIIVASTTEDNIECALANTTADLLFCGPQLLPNQFCCNNASPLKVILASNGSYAPVAFEQRAFDYLQQPVTLGRLKKTINAYQLEIVHQYPIGVLSKSGSQHTRHYIKEGNKFHWFSLADIIYFESAGNYVKIYQKDSSPVFYSSLNYLADKLPADQFFRANRSYLINVEHIRNISQIKNGKIVLTLSNDFSIELSQRQTTAFRLQHSL